jgi:lysophospholipase L1-like esterase
MALYHYLLEHNFSHQYVQLAKRITEDKTWIDTTAFQLYQDNLQEMVDICQTNKIQAVFFITVTKNQIHNANIQYSKHQKAMMAVADRNNLLKVSAMDIFRQNRSQELFADGGHPNELGHQLIADEIFKTLIDSIKFER